MPCDFLALISLYENWKHFFLRPSEFSWSFNCLLLPWGKLTAHLDLSCQIFVFVTDDRQSRLLTQSVGTVSERLLQSWRRRTAYFFITKAQTSLVWSWEKRVAQRFDYSAWFKQMLFLANMTSSSDVYVIRHAEPLSVFTCLPSYLLILLTVLFCLVPCL